MLEKIPSSLYKTSKTLKKGNRSVERKKPYDLYGGASG